MIEGTVVGSITLTNADVSSLKAAITAGGDVKLALDGVFYLDETLVVAANTVLDATGHQVELDGGAAVRHFVITNGVTLRLINLGLINGVHRATNSPSDGRGETAWGGAVHSNGGKLELLSCRFVNNAVFGGDGEGRYNPGGPGRSNPGGPAFGGAIYCTNGQIWTKSRLFASNSCYGGKGSTVNTEYTVPGGDAFGGAVYCAKGELTMLETTFTNNLARGGEVGGVRALIVGGGSANGGALACAGDRGLISNCVFVANQTVGSTHVSEFSGSANGGALFQGFGTMEIDRTLLSRNSAAGTGRGLAPQGASSEAASGRGGAVFLNSGVLQIRNSALTFNEALGGRGGGGGVGGFPHLYGGPAEGGAIFGQPHEGELTMINCTLAHNLALGGKGSPGGSARGGAVSAHGSLINVTIANNSARVGETMVSVLEPYPVRGASIYGWVAMTNSILSCSTSETNVVGAIDDGGYNISSDTSANFTTPFSRNGVDPLLGPLTDNGGPTPTLSLLPASPAIDAADSTCPVVDQRGVARPQGARCDIGALELIPELTLDRGLDGKVTLTHLFQALGTNSASSSTNLTVWKLLDAKVADTNGVTRWEDMDAMAFPERFYKVEPQREE